MVQLEIQENIVGYIYVTSTDTSVELPMIGNVRMLPGKEYWVLYSSSSDISGVYAWWSRNYSATSSLRFHVRGPLNGNVGVSHQYQCFQASELATWTSGNTTLPTTSFPFGNGAGDLKGVTLQFKDNIPTQFWWLQSGSGNLQPLNLNGVTLTAQTGTPPSTDYAAPSTLEWFDPSR